MTDGDKPKLKHAIHSRGSNKVGSVDITTEESICLNKSKEEGPSPIHLFAINGEKGKLQEELRRGKWDINEIDQLGRTPLVYGVLGDRIECVALLLKVGADINIADVDERTALHWAAYQGNHKLVKLLLSKGADKIKRDKEGRTPLHLSTSHDNIKVMEALLRSMKEQDINLDDNNKVTPLCWSVFYDCIRYTRLLLKHGADASIMDKESRTVLHWTSQNKDPSILKLLVEVVETLINWPDCQGRTVLHMTIGRSNISLVQFLLTVPTIDINAKDTMGRTPLHWAAVLGNTNIVSLLLEKGADHTVSDNNGVFPLHYAAQTDSRETVVAMLDKEGIKDVPDNEHGTALMWAAVKGSDKVLEILLEKKCSDVNAVDAHMQTALHKCTQSGHLNCVKILIKHGAEVNVYDTKHHIPLFYACASGHGEIVKELLSYGSSSNLDDKDLEGRCPIHYAAMVDRTDIIKILMKHNSKANIQDNDGCTPLHFAAFLGFVHCISVLLENGANVELQDNVGRTALHLACRSGSVDAVKLLVSRFNASVNVLAHEGEQLTPLDYAILEDHQDVALYLQTENDAYTAIALKELSATKIQSVWKGYSYRKSFKPLKHFLVKHEIERKNTIDGTTNNALLLSCKTEHNILESKQQQHLGYTFESRKIPSDFDSQGCHSRSESKQLNSLQYQQGVRSNVSSGSCYTVSSKSSICLPPETLKSYGALHKPKIAMNENGVLFKDIVFDGLLINPPSKQKGLRKLSHASNRNYQEQLTSKRTQKISTNSLHSYSRYHQSNSPVSSSSSSDMFTNNSSKNNDNINHSCNKSYSRYNSENKDVIKSSSSESSILFNLKPIKSSTSTYMPQTKPVDIKETINKSDDAQQKISVNINIGQEDAPKVRFIPPDTNLEKPWNIYRRDQKRINIIRQQTNAAMKIQEAFRRYRRKKYLPSKVDDTSADSKDNRVPSETYTDIDSNAAIEENSDDDIQEVAALLIQLAWRQYVKNKLLSERYKRDKKVVKLPIPNIWQPSETWKPPFVNCKNENKTEVNSKQNSNSSSGKKITKTKTETVNSPLTFIQEVYLPDSMTKSDNQLNTSIPLKAPIVDQPNCRPQLRSNSAKLKSPAKSPAKSNTNVCKQPGKKAQIVKSAEVK